MSLETLRAAVAAAPYDDAPRLAYADAIATTEPDHAELIRLDLDYRRTGETMSRRHLVLSGQQHARAFDYLSSHVDGGVRSRGFIEHVMIDAARFLGTAAELYGLAPVLHVDFKNARPVLAELFDSPHLERLLSLSFLRNELDDADMKIIAGSTRLKSLEYLELTLNQVGDAGVETLAASTALARVDYLGLSANPCKDPTPQHCDEYDADSLAATELKKKYGPRLWLSASPVRATWPPNRYTLWAASTLAARTSVRGRRRTGSCRSAA